MNVDIRKERLLYLFKQIILVKNNVQFQFFHSVL